MPKTAVNARRIALQMTQTTIIAAPDGLRDQLSQMTRMQLIRSLTALQPDLSTCRDLVSAYRIRLKFLTWRYLELQDESADLDVMIGAIVEELTPKGVS